MQGNEIKFILSVDNADAERKTRQTTQSIQGLGDTVKAMGGDWNRASSEIADANSFFATTDNIFRNVRQSGAGAADSLKGVAAGADHVKVGIRDGMGEMRSFANALGVTLPYATERWLAKMEGLQPLMAAAFSTSAIVGMLQIAADIPHVFDVISAAVTGWNAKSKKAYAEEIDLNREYIKVLKDAQQEQINLQVRVGDLTSTEGVKKTIANKQGDLGTINAEMVRIQGEQALRRQIAQNPNTADLAGTPASSLMLLHPSAESDEDLANKLKSAAAEAGKLVVEIQRLKTIDIQDAAVEDAAKWFGDAEKRARAFQEQVKAGTEAQKRLQDLLARDRDKLIATLPELERVSNYKATEEDAKGYIQLLDERIKAADEKIKNLDYWERAGLDYRNASATGGPFKSEIEAGEKVNDTSAKKIIERYDLLKRESEKFINSFREGAGRVWDDFFISGKHVMADLRDIGLSLFNTIGRTLFQNFATGLLTGGKGSTGTGLFGSAGNLGARIGGAIGLGALFSGHAAAQAAAPAVTTIGNSTVIAGTSAGLGTAGLGMVPPGPPSLGLAGVLGLHGGAGLFGLGAATIPVLGGIAAGVFGLYKLLHHSKPNYTAGVDPFSELRSHTYSFNTTFPFEGLTNAITDLKTAVNRVNNTMDRVDTLPPGQVMLDNFAAIKQPVTDSVLSEVNSSRQYRRGLAGSILEMPI